MVVEPRRGGASVDVGVLFIDRVAVFAHLTGDTVYVSGIGTIALMAEDGFEHFTVATGFGLGAAGSFAFSGTGFSSPVVPLAIGWTPSARKDDVVVSVGLHLTLEGGAGFAGPGTMVWGGLRIGYVRR